MGRVSRYKKVKSIDPFAKNGSWKSDVGDCATLRRVKRKSKTALKLKEQKNAKFQRRARGKNKDNGGRKTGGSNGWGDDDGYDLPPEGEDEFDMRDLLGSVKKQTHKVNPLLEMKSEAKVATVSSSVEEKWTRKVEKVDLRGVVTPSTGNSDNSNSQSSKNGKKNGGGNKTNSKGDGSLTITAKTPTREIIEACNNPKSKKQTMNDTSSSSSGLSKQEKRKAFFDKKKSKKRKRGNGMLDDDDDDDYSNQQATLQSLHSQPTTTLDTQQKQSRPKKHLVKQQNYSDTLIARTAIDDQVERPPTFTSLPRGANKLSKNKKAKHSNTNNASVKKEGDVEKAERIRKEQMALEAMRKKVMMQYAALRESRRGGGR